MLINRKFVFTAAVALALGVSSCKKFNNVNTNPNVSQNATVQTLLPAAELYVGSGVGVDLQIAGSIWSQYWTQTPAGNQYIALEQFNPGQDQAASGWTNLYAGAENLFQLSQLADSLHKKSYQAIALILEAYTFQVITDGWGNAPYKQALQGQYVYGHKINPQYDSQIVIYNGIINFLDSANKLLKAGGGAPTTDDLIYGGDMGKWQRFANTLRLKVLLREIYIDPTGATKKIDTMYDGSPAFMGAGDDAKITYGANLGNKNPLYAEESSVQLGSVQNFAGSKTCIDSMNNNGDPRVRVFYEATSGGNYTGLTQGTYNIPAAAGSYSIPGTAVAGDGQNAASANAPVILISSWESFFLQAEAGARGLGAAAGNDNANFASGIQASFTYYNIAGSYPAYINSGATWTVYPAGGTLAQKLRAIITQKWFAMCGNQGFEAWAEYRRTGYPDFLVQPASSVIGGQRPERLLYPTSESTSNAGFPGLQPVTTRVWWDIN